MSRWPGKYVIGLTGNIATGKSLVRRMLEHLGAFGIDADELAARAMSPGGPAYRPVVDTFGMWILDADAEIDREKLANVVFTYPEALTDLETIVHPVVLDAIDIMARRAEQSVVAIEAIKLLESGLAGVCDAIWVVDAPEELQVARLVEKRGLNDHIAWQRINAQPPQSQKRAYATVIIDNTDSLETLWGEVQREWSILMGAPPPEPERVEAAEEVEPEPVTEIEPEPVAEVEPEPVTEVEPEPVQVEAEEEPEPEPVTMAEPVEISPEQLFIERGRPSDAQLIANFINQVSRDGGEVTRADVMAAFGQKAYLMAVSGDTVIGLAGWQVENLITTVDEFYLRGGVPAPQVVALLLEAIEQASAELQSEISLLFVSNDAPDETVQVFVDAGYEPREIEEIKVLMWREAAAQLQPPNTRLLAKRLREDRVLKPL